MIEAIAQTDHFQRFLWRHRVFGNFGDQRDIFAGGQRRHEIVKLEHEADRIAAIFG